MRKKRLLKYIQQIYNQHKKTTYVIALLMFVSISACSIYYIEVKIDNHKQKESLDNTNKNTEESINNNTDDNKNKEKNDNVNEHDLPISKAEKSEAINDCNNMMELIREVYINADKGEAANTVISDDKIEEMKGILTKTGYPIYGGRYLYNLSNYERVIEFISNAEKGEIADVTIYDIHSDGNLGRRKYTYDGENMYVFSTICLWNDKNEINYSEFNKTLIKQWHYTNDGWFCYEISVPEVSEIMLNDVLIRVVPVSEEYLNIEKKYLQPISYQGNNLFSTDWDSEHMENIDYNGLYEYIYLIEYGELFDYTQYPDGIPQGVFEELITGYMPVTKEQLREYANYDSKQQLYRWVKLGCGNYILNDFGDSTPVLSDATHNEDGTQTWTVNAVCERVGNQILMSHKLRIRYTQNDGIEFLENSIVGGKDNVTEYIYRN